MRVEGCSFREISLREAECDGPWHLGLARAQVIDFDGAMQRVRRAATRGLTYGSPRAAHRTASESPPSAFSFNTYPIAPASIAYYSNIGLSPPSPHDDLGLPHHRRPTRPRRCSTRSPSADRAGVFTNGGVETKSVSRRVGSTQSYRRGRLPASERHANELVEVRVAAPSLPRITCTGYVGSHRLNSVRGALHAMPPGLVWDQLVTGRAPCPTPLFNPSMGTI